MLPLLPLLLALPCLAQDLALQMAALEWQTIDAEFPDNAQRGWLYSRAAWVDQDTAPIETAYFFGAGEGLTPPTSRQEGAKLHFLTLTCHLSVLFDPDFF